MQGVLKRDSGRLIYRNKTLPAAQQAKIRSQAFGFSSKSGVLPSGTSRLKP